MGRSNAVLFFITSLLSTEQGGAISQKNSRPVIILHEAADFSGLDQQIS